MTRRATLVLMSIVALIGAGVGIALFTSGDETSAPEVVSEQPATAKTPRDEGSPSCDKPSGAGCGGQVRRKLEAKLADPDSTGCETVRLKTQGKAVIQCIASRGPLKDDLRSSEAD